MSRSSADDGFDEFAAAAWPRLLRSAYLLTGDHHLAEDLAQTALVRTYAHWRRVRRADALAYSPPGAGQPQHRPDPAQARDVEVGDQLARDRRRRDRTPGSTSATRRSGCCARLTERERQVVVLRHYFDLSEAEVAARARRRQGHGQEHPLPRARQAARDRRGRRTATTRKWWDSERRTHGRPARADAPRPPSPSRSSPRASSEIRTRAGAASARRLAAGRRRHRRRGGRRSRVGVAAVTGGDGRAGPTTRPPVGAPAADEMSAAGRSGRWREVPGAIQVSSWQVVIPLPAGADADVRLEQDVPADHVAAGPVDIGTRWYTGVTTFRTKDFPAWLYDGVADYEQHVLGDEDGYPVGSTDIGVIVDAGPLRLACMQPCPTGARSEGDRCFPAMLAATDGDLRLPVGDGHRRLPRSPARTSSCSSTDDLHRRLAAHGVDRRHRRHRRRLGRPGRPPTAAPCRATVEAGTFVPGDDHVLGHGRRRAGQGGHLRRRRERSSRSTRSGRARTRSTARCADPQRPSRGEVGDQGAVVARAAGAARSTPVAVSAPSSRMWSSCSRGASLGKVGPGRRRASCPLSATARR